MINLGLSDPAAERGVLSGVFNFGTDAYLDVADLLDSESFTIDSNQYIWKCFKHLFDSGTVKLDYPTIISAANSLGLGRIFDREDEKAHLRAIMNFPIKLENVRDLAGKVKKLDIARKLLTKLQLASDNIEKVTGNESIDSILAIAEEPISELTTMLMSSSDGPKLIGDGLKEYVMFLSENTRSVIGIPSGFKSFDKAIGGGFRPGTVNMIGARPKIGKSLLAMNIGIRVSSGGYYDWPKINKANAVPVLCLDTEMTREDQWTRMLAFVSGVQINDIESGLYAKNSKSKKLVEDAARKLSELPYDFLSIAGQPFEETVAVMRRWISKKVGFNPDGSAKPCLIIFDYIKLMNSDSMNAKNMQEYQVLGFMMTGLHNFAVRYKVPILGFVQLNREGINVEDTNAASGSDRIIWLCSNFSIYKKKTDEEIAEQKGFNRKLVPIVARHGAGLDDGDYINVNSLGHIATINEGPTRYQIANGTVKSNPNENKGFVVDESISRPGQITFAANNDVF